MMRIGGLANTRTNAGKTTMAVTARLGMIAINDALARSADLTRSVGQSMRTRKKHHQESAAKAQVGRDLFDTISVMKLPVLVHAVIEAGAEAVPLVDVATVNVHIPSARTVVFEAALEVQNALIAMCLDHPVAKFVMPGTKVRKEIGTLIVTKIGTIPQTLTATYRPRATEQAKSTMDHDTETKWTIAREIGIILIVIEIGAATRVMTEIDAETGAEARVSCPMIDGS